MHALFLSGHIADKPNGKLFEIRHEEFHAEL